MVLSSLLAMGMSRLAVSHQRPCIALHIAQWVPAFHLLPQIGLLITACLQVQNSDKTSLLTCLLEGPVGSGKSSMAATMAIESEFPFVKVISPESLVGYNEQVST